MARDTSTHATGRPGEPRAETTSVAGRYELREVLGRGSMGTVHRARDLVLDRDVALKLFPAEAADPEHALRYEQEARLLARLSHPGLVAVYDAGIDVSEADEPRPYLVMQLVTGRTLAERLRDGALPPAEVATLAAQLASALAHIHRSGIVHRDVKPANILLTPPGERGPGAWATLTDFGIARLVDGTRMTMTGFTLGTANYLSPEQLTGEDVGPPSDVYSLGLVLLECLTGQVAYPGYGIEAALPRLQRPPAIPQTLPAGWADLLSRMTQLRPTARPGAEEVAVLAGGLGALPDPHLAETQVLPATAANPGSTTALPLPPAAAIAARRHLLRPALLIGAVAALIVLIAIIAVAGSGGGGPMPTGPMPTGPAYPSVGGQLGDHLRQLQQDVRP